MLAVESGRVCNMSPENTAADFGTSLPFSQAAPFVYNMADAVSPASITCAGNRINSKQHTADRNAEDRKSTRLNSSHQIISYAVFCLKKKSSRPERSMPRDRHASAAVRPELSRGSEPPPGIAPDSRRPDEQPPEVQLPRALYVSHIA